MTVAYFDSSALVKLVVEEEGTADVVALWNAAAAVISNRLAHPEVRAALAGANRDGRLDGEDHERAKERWYRYRASLRMVELTRELEEAAGELAQRHALSGSDALHLAAALTLTEVEPVVATWDRRLLRASQESGLATLPARLQGGPMP